MNESDVNEVEARGKVQYVWANDNAMPRCELRKVGASEGAEERKGPKELEDLAH